MRSQLTEGFDERMRQRALVAVPITEPSGAQIRLLRRRCAICGPQDDLRVSP
jgi:hypothetical protein